MAGPVDRRTFLTRSAKTAGAIAVLGTGGGLLAGCSGEAAQQPTGAAPPTGRPRRGGHLRIGTWTEETGVNPTQDTWTSVGDSYANAIYDSLCTVADDGSVVPYLARTLDHNDDYTEWTITLREGIAFHDGSELDAEVVATNFEASVTSPAFAASLGNVDDIRVADPRTVVVTTKIPWVPFDVYLAGQFGTIASVDTVRGRTERPVGTGPFVFEEWQNGNHFTATRNPNYWREGLPYLDQITFRPVLNSPQRENSVKAGNLEIGLTGSTISNLRALRDDPRLVYYDDSDIDVLQPHHVSWQLNMAVKPLDDVRVRRALALSLDQRKFHETVFHGANSATGWDAYAPVTSFFVPGTEYHSKTGYPERPDPEQARRLIEEYTAENGRPSFKVTAIHEPSEQRALALTKSMWEPLGIDVEIQQIDVGRLIEDLVNGEFQVTFVDLFAAVDPDQNYVYWSPTTVAPVGEPALNFAHNENPRIQELLEAGRTSADPQSRRSAYQEIDQILNGEDFPNIYMGRSIGAAFTRPVVGGMGQATSPEGTRLLFSPGVVGPAELWLAAGA